MRVSFAGFTAGFPPLLVCGSSITIVSASVVFVGTEKGRPSSSQFKQQIGFRRWPRLRQDSALREYAVDNPQLPIAAGSESLIVRYHDERFLAVPRQVQQ